MRGIVLSSFYWRIRCCQKLHPDVHLKPTVKPTNEPSPNPTTPDPSPKPTFKPTQEPTNRPSKEPNDILCFARRHKNENHRRLQMTSIRDYYALFSETSETSERGRRRRMVLRRDCCQLKSRPKDIGFNCLQDSPDNMAQKSAFLY